MPISRRMPPSGMRRPPVTVCRFRQVRNWIQRSWSRRFPVATDLGGGRGQRPPVVHGLPGPVTGAVMPGGLDQQPAGVAIAGLGDRALAAGAARGVLGRTRPTKEPMLSPVNRCQSPISTASANPVNVAIPRRQPSRRTSGVNSLSAASCAISASSRSRRAVTVKTSLVAGVEARLGARPTAVGSVVAAARRRAAWSRPFRRCQTMPYRSNSFDSRCRARIRSARQSYRARTRSRAASCSIVGHRHRHDLIQPQQPRQTDRVPGIGLDPITRRSLQLRRRRHLAADPGRDQMPVQPEPGGGGLIGHRHRTRQLGQPRTDVIKRSARNLGWNNCTRDTVDRRRRDRSGVHIEPNTRTLRKHRGLPPTAG